MLLRDGVKVEMPRPRHAALKDPCPKLGTEHQAEHWQKLGKKDNGMWTWRCGNCLEVRESEKETGPVPGLDGKLGPSSIG